VQNYNWDIRTQFVFPEEYGIVEDVVSVDIKPRFQLIETEESLRLVGIYHITSTVRFNPYELPEYSEGTLIEHIELNGNDGYFEYALPLEVNLPKEKVPTGCHPEVYIEDIYYDVNDGSSATFNWDVSCAISEPVIQPEIEPVNEEEMNQFEPSLDTSNEVPNEQEFTDWNQNSEPTTDELQFDDVIEEAPVPLEEEYENVEPVEFEDTSNNIESLSEVDEQTPILQSSNVFEPEIEESASEVEQANHHFNYLEKLVQSDNVLQNEEPIDRAFEDDDFFSSLSESYTTLDLKLNKISPEEESN